MWDLMQCNLTGLTPRLTERFIMKCTNTDIQQFALWSGDHNPLHVDPAAAAKTSFGRPIAHGILSVLKALRASSEYAAPLAAIDVEFRGAVFPDAEQQIEVAVSDPQQVSINVRSGDSLAVSIRGTRCDHSHTPGGAISRVASPVDVVRTHHPVESVQEHNVSDFIAGREIRGIYRTSAIPTELAGIGYLGPAQMRTLALCSYLVGMQWPGLRSLFTKLSLTLEPTNADATDLYFEVRIVGFDANFRLLDLDLSVTTPTGVPVASGRLRSYVRFSPIIPDLPRIQANLEAGSPQLQGKVALVCGSTRGLGADVTAALALSGCQVFATYRSDTAGAEQFSQLVSEHGTTVQLLHGDSGDATWCRGVRDMIERTCGRLDLLVLNACAPPSTMHIGPESIDAFGRYVHDNLQLVSTPLATFGELLRESSGTVVGISSSFVRQAVVGFPHYIALKQAVEATIQVFVAETKVTHGLLVRPPRLLTSWNDTPTGILGAIGTERVAVRTATRLATGWRAGTVEILEEFPVLSVGPAKVELGEESTDTDSIARIVVASSFTADSVLPGLNFWIKELGIAARAVLAPYGQINQELLNPQSQFARNKGGVNVVLLRIADWLHELESEKASSLGFLQQYLAGNVRDLVDAIRTHRATAKSETVVVIGTSPDQIDGDISRLLSRTESDLASAIRDVPGVQVLVAQDLHPIYEVAADTIHDPLREKVAHIPYKDGYWPVLATMIARRVHRKFNTLRKVVVVDCDNTLWRGVVGEVGVEGIAFDGSHLALHAVLTRLSRQGLLVCLCSKNEEFDVWQVFDHRPDFRLRRESIVAAAINWRPKSENLRHLATRLNLGLDSFIFVDDNPVECAEVRANLPEVLVLQWPQSAEQACQLLEHTWEFDCFTGTTEDQKRTQMYREEFQRQELLQNTLTFKSFIDSLQLVVEIEPLQEADLARASQLTLRTNQFNFTTRRRETAELQALRSGGKHQILTVRVRDRYGDYGLVGLMIAEFAEPNVIVDTFLLSCRVLGRGVEHRMLAELGRLVIGERGTGNGEREGRIRIRIETTKRNAPARAFVESVFAEVAGLRTADRFECEVSASELANVVFNPPEQAPELPQEGERVSTAASSNAPLVLPRDREQQIQRTVFSLRSAAQLQAALCTGQPSALPAESDGGEPIDEVVCATFARILKTTPDRVRELDRLEVLGCDSFNIVEITVALASRYPWIPSTILFEHQSVSSITAHLSQLASSARAGAVSVVPAADRSANVSRPDVEHFDIAVTGLDLRCSGANSADELWELLSARRSAVRPVPAERPWFLGRLDDDRPHWAAMIDGIGGFDAEFFGVSPREAEQMDPQLRLFLEVAWGALEDAALTGVDFVADTGVFVGVMYGDYGYLANRVGKAKGNPYRCWEGFSLANRLSHLLGFTGPSIAVDTACSSSGTALHLACQSLRAGSCRAAVVGGVNLILDPDRFVALGRLGILSTQGACLPFSAAADGTLLGEGAAAVVLRPVSDALRRGDRIYGVIKGTGVSTGHGTVGFTAPNPQAQADAIRRCLKDARIDPRTISYVETHGTGTILGDPIELRGLSVAYSDRQFWSSEVSIAPHCAVGSIKGNVGHLEAGAAVLGFVKLMKQFEHKELLPSVCTEPLNPQIPFDTIPFEVQKQSGPWHSPVLLRDGQSVPIPRRAGINSFGVGGANVHLIAEEAPPRHPEKLSTDDRPLHLVTLSARCEESLRSMAANLASHLERRPDMPLADVAFSLNVGRRHHEHRVAIVCSDRRGLMESLAGVATPPAGAAVQSGTVARSAARPKIAMLFTGQGAQYPGMAKGLYDTQPVFRAALDKCDTLLRPLLPRRLLEVMFAPEDSETRELIHQTGFTQPCLFAFEFAMSELWRSWGVEPNVVMGHSVGEIAAFCSAGGISLEDGVTMIAARGRFMQALPSGGAMYSIMAGEAQVQATIAGYECDVSIAAVNAPQQVVISGTAAALNKIVERFQQQGVRVKQLTVSHAFHSPMMDAMIDDYAAVVRKLILSPPQIPFISAVTGRVAGHELADAEYWIRQIREPVRFADGMKTLQQMEIRGYLEVGPQPVLLGNGRQCLSDVSDDTMWLASMRKDGDGWQTLLSSLASLHVHGMPIDWKGFDSPYSRQFVSLPSYRFAKRDYWIKIDGVKHVTLQESAPSHSRLLYNVEWPELPRASSNGAQSDRGTWLVIADDGRAGELICNRLASKGCRTISVANGPGYKRYAESHFALNLQSDADFDCLAKAIGERNCAINGIVFLPALESESASSLTGERLSEVGTHLLTVAGRVLKLASVLPGRTPPKVWFLTRGAAPIGDYDIESPAATLSALLWGLGRTAALELPEHWGGIIDLGPAPQPSPAEVGGLVEELLHSNGDDQIAIRGKMRHVARLAPVQADGYEQASIRSDGSYLITGGTGALGIHVAEWLVSRGATDILLVSRRGTVEGTSQDKVNHWKSRGVRISLAAADISCEAEVTRVVGMFGPERPLRGIIHAAGVDHESRICDAISSDIRRVLASKVGGGWLLDRATREMSLDFFVCFSSISAVIGSTGHGHYAAANAFLDQLMLDRRRRRLPGLSIAWGPWSGGGMADPDSLRRFEAIGNRGLDLQEATRVLDRAIGNANGSLTVADIDWERFLPTYQARRRSSLLSNIGSSRKSVDATDAKASSAASTTYPWVHQLQLLQPEQRHSELSRLLRAEIATALGMASPESVAVDRTFTEMGMDSLLSVDFASRLQRNLGIRGSSWIFDHPRLDLLTTQLLTLINVSENKSVNRATSSNTGIDPRSPVSTTRQEWASKLLATPEVSRLDTLKAMLRAEIANTLGFASATEVADDKTFSEMGMDSLLSVGFASRLQRMIGVGKSTFVFDYPNVDSLAAQLLSLIGAGIADTADSLPVTTVSGDSVSTPRIVSYTPEIESGVYRFLEEAFEHRTCELAQSRWRWMFLESAKRLGVEPRVWLASDNKRIVGHHGSIPVRVKLGDKVLDSAWHVDTRVLEEYWSRAVGGRLMAQATDDIPFSLSLGQTPQSRQMIKHLGWQQVATLQIAHYLIRPERVLQGKMLAPVASAAGLALRASRAARGMFRSRSQATVRHVGEFDASHDRLWEIAQRDLCCAVVRDASYLNWKWVQQPGQDAARIEIVDGNECRALAVLIFRDADAAYPYRRAFLVDLVVPMSNRRVTQNLIEAACEVAAEREADSVVCMHTSPSLGRALRDSGFLFREPTRYLLVSTGGLSESDRDLLLHKANWFLTQSDSDIDRPE